MAFVDLCRFVPTLGGTTDWVYSSAVGGCQGPAAANVLAGQSYYVYAVSADQTQWEVSTGVNSGGTTFPRTTVLCNSSGTGTSAGQSGAGTKINFSTVPQVSVVALAEDLSALAQMRTVATRTALKALDTTVVTSAILSEAGREGTFTWKTGNYAALVTADTTSAIYIAANAIATTVGAWVRVRTDGVYNVKWFGAAGDGSTDDTTSINAAISLAGTNLGGDILFPQGSYLISSTLTLSVALTRIIGVGKRYCSIKSTTAAIGSLISIAAARCDVSSISLFHQVVPTSSGALITLASGAVQCTINDFDMDGGYYCLQALTGSANVLVRDGVMRQAWIGASVYTHGAGAIIFENIAFDQNWPNAVPTSANDKTAAGRLNTTAYVLNDVTTLSGTLLQCTQAGTTGGSPPSMTGVWFNTSITDGTVKWQVAGNSGGCAVQVDTGSTYITFKDCDLTGSYLYAAQVTNSLGGTAPDVIRFVDCTPAGMLSHAINLVAGKGIWVEGCEIEACVGAGANRYGISVGSGITGEIYIRGNRITSGFTNGIFLANVSFGSVLVHGNMVFGLGIAINVGAGVSNFNIVGNNVGSSALFGTNTYPIAVQTGASDHYIISQNRINGTTNPVADAGSGVNKSVTANF